MHKKAFFIVFEGIEGSGKSYQAKILYKKLKKKYKNIILTREPGGTKAAEIIRNIILKDYFEKDKKIKFDKYTDTLLYLAARNEHVKNKILPAIKKRKIIICDRFTDSTIAYQVYGKKVSFEFIKNIHKKILSNIKPDLIFILKVKKQSFIKRLKKRKTRNRYDNFPTKFYLKAQKSFLKISNNKNKYIVLDSSNNTTELQNKVFNIVINRLGVKV
jgi:dTMP kinase